MCKYLHPCGLAAVNSPDNGTLESLRSRRSRRLTRAFGVVVLGALLTACGGGGGGGDDGGGDPGAGGGGGGPVPSGNTPSLREDFTSYSAGADPAGWLYTGLNNSLATSNTIFELQQVDGDLAIATNDVNGANAHAHYVVSGSSAWINYRFSGRVRVEGLTDGIGVTVASDYPNSDSYYRLRRFGNNSFHIAPHGAGIECNGTTDTGVVPIPSVWYNFKIEVGNTGSETQVRAKVWAESELEPTGWQADCVDVGTRLTSGTVGLWALGGSDSGAKFWDDLAVNTVDAATFTGVGGGGSGEPSPTVELTSNLPTVNSGADLTLSWTTTNATSCTAAGATASGTWSGAQALAGSVVVTPVGDPQAPLSADQTFTLSCSGAGGTTDDSVSVTVVRVGTGTALVSWTPPTQNDDGSTLTDLDGYTVYFGPSATNTPNQVVVTDGTATSLPISNLPSGEYFFRIKSRNSSGRESDFSTVTAASSIVVP